MIFNDLSQVTVRILPGRICVLSSKDGYVHIGFDVVKLINESVSYASVEVDRIRSLQGEIASREGAYDYFIETDDGNYLYDKSKNTIHVIRISFMCWMNHKFTYKHIYSGCVGNIVPSDVVLGG